MLNELRPPLVQNFKIALLYFKLVPSPSSVQIYTAFLRSGLNRDIQSLCGLIRKVSSPL